MAVPFFPISTPPLSFPLAEVYPWGVLWGYLLDKPFEMHFLKNLPFHFWTAAISQNVLKKKKTHERKSGSKHFKVLLLYFCACFAQTERSHCFPAAVWCALMELWSALVGAAKRDLLSLEASTLTALRNCGGRWKGQEQGGASVLSLNVPIVKLDKVSSYKSGFIYSCDSFNYVFPQAQCLNGWWVIRKCMIQFCLTCNN